MAKPVFKKDLGKEESSGKNRESFQTIKIPKAKNDLTKLGFS